MIEIPTEFIERIKNQFFEDWEEMIEKLNDNPRTSIRLNSKKKAELNFELEEKIDWCPTGYFLKSRPNFTMDCFIHSGVYYVQEASSMAIDFIYKQLSNSFQFESHLDLCAAPGGKSTLLLDNFSTNQFLISNEVIPKRNIVLRENLTKWGNPNILVTENKVQDFKKLKNYFDFVLIDAPCSGEGMFRKDEQARIEWSIKNVNNCSLRQLDILENIWPSIREGGIVIYSTCTFASEENERLLDKFHQAGYEFECIEIEFREKWNIRKVEYNQIIGYQFLPNKVKGEGFFCSVLRKKGELNVKRKINSSSHINSWLENYLDINQLKNHSTYKFKNSLFLSINQVLDDLPMLQSNLYIKQIGIEVGNYKGEDIYVNHGLAMLNIASIYNRKINLKDEEAVEFLKTNSVQIEIENGQYLILYKSQNIGWGNVIDNELKSLYPIHWKIRKY